MFFDLLETKEFVNPNKIARGISPFRPGTVSPEAGRIMLKRIDELSGQKQDFAFEPIIPEENTRIAVPKGPGNFCMRNV